jgi:arylsulfatase A-like enzyme
VLHILLVVLGAMLVGALLESIRLSLQSVDSRVVRASWVGVLALTPLLWALICSIGILLTRLSAARWSLTPAAARVWLATQMSRASGLALAVLGAAFLSFTITDHPPFAAVLTAVAGSVSGVVALWLTDLLSSRLSAACQSTGRPWLHPYLLTFVAIALPAGVFAAHPQIRDATPWWWFLELLVGLTTAATLWYFMHRRQSILWSAVGIGGLAAMALAFGVGPFMSPDIAGLLAERSRSLSLTSISKTLARYMTDIDGDGVGLLFGDVDCAPFDASIHPMAIDIPGNGYDENCSGEDTAMWQRAPDPRKLLPIPSGLEHLNFLLITVDAMRSDHTGFGGYNRNTTQNLDKLVRHAAVFTHLEATSSGTITAFPSLFTSRYFYEQVRCQGDTYPPAGGWHHCILHPDHYTLAERLRALGLTTSAVVSHAYFEGWGLEQGFVRWKAAHPKARDLTFSSAKRVTELAIEEISALRNNRFFLWVHYFDPHARYVPHEEEKIFGDTPRDRYDGEIAHVDRYLGVLFNALASMDLAERTAIFITSDHGEEFVDEHGGSDHTWAVYNSSTRVPLIIYLPAVRPLVSHIPVSMLDLMPTLVHLGGGGARLGPDIEGISLIPAVLGTAPVPKERPVFAEAHHPRPLRSVILNGYKLIVDLTGAPPKLYDNQKDIANINNIASHHPAVVSELRELLDGWRFAVETNGRASRSSARTRVGAK